MGGGVLPLPHDTSGMKTFPCVFFENLYARIKMEKFKPITSQK